MEPRALAPVAVLAAKVNSVEGVVPPSTVRSANDAAWPSIGWLTFFSFEYSCIAPMIRLVPGSDLMPMSTIHFSSGDVL